MARSETDTEDSMMAVLQRTPGRKVTRRLQEPSSFIMGGLRRSEPGDLAAALAAAHNRAVQEYGSNSGGVHAFKPDTRKTEGVFEAGGTYPRDTVVTQLAWGKISAELVQRILEMDGVA